MSSLEPATLTDGSLLEIDHLAPGEGRGTGPAQVELLAFMAQPFAPWFSPAEAQGLGQCISGAAGPALADHLYVGRRDGQIAGAVWHATSADRPEVGVFGFVWTDPGMRGLGIARLLTDRSVTQFWADGGRASYLGTANPTARRVYEDSGYRPYHGAVMRALRPGLDGADFEAAWFHPGSDVTLCDATFADVAAYTALVTMPEPETWHVRDFTERLFVVTPDHPLMSCTRPFLSSWIRHDSNPANVFRVAVVRSGAIVAAVAISAAASGPGAGSAVLEVLAHPAHRAAATDLLADCLGRARSSEVREIRAYADPGDRLELLCAAGFVEESTMRGYLRSSERTVDVQVLRWEPAG